MDKWERYEENDTKMRSQYHDPIERLPEKIDQLLEMLDRVNSFIGELYLTLFYLDLSKSILKSCGIK